MIRVGPRTARRDAPGLWAHQTAYEANALELRRIPPATTATITTRPSEALDICGFISGDPDFPLTCYPGQRCAKDPIHSLVACCWNPTHGTCMVSTRCLDQFQSQMENVFDSLDMLCFDGRAPYCKTDVLTGDSEVDGYSLFICDTDKVTETVLRYTTQSGVDSKTTALNSTPSQTPMSSLAMSSPYTDANSMTPSHDAPHTPSTSTSTVVGAVVGSLGALAVAIAGAWALWQLKKQKLRRRAFSGEKPLELDHHRADIPATTISPVELPCH